jgi:elongation factor G
MGSSFKNKAVQNLLDAIIDYLPNPVEKKEIQGYELDSDKKKIRKLELSAPFLAIVFKTVTDKHADQIIYFRTYAGKLKIGDPVYNARTSEKVKISKLFHVHANKLEKVDAVYYGDIAVTMGIPNIATGDTLCSTNDKIRLDQIVFPEPVVASTIEPQLTSDHDRLNEVLNKLMLEDPTFKVAINKDTGQTVISGMGELHIEVIKERIKREFKIDAKLGKPRVSYRESVRNTVTAEDNYVTEIAGKSQTGHVVIEVSPHKSSKKLEFVIDVKNHVIPKEMHQAIKNGIKDSMSVGILAGFPMTDLKVRLISGSYQEDTATEFAYKVAASNALRKACREAVPVLMEPIMKVEILVQDDYLGEVIGDFNSRDGKVTRMNKKHNINIIDGFAPLSNMFGYATGLRTLTQGRANYTMEFHDYVQMTEKKMQRVLKEQLGIYTYN